MPQRDEFESNNASPRKSTTEEALTVLQKGVFERLQIIFPKHTPEILQMSVRDPSNLAEPLDADVALQRCLDDVLEGRTAADLYTRSGKSYKTQLTPVQRTVQSHLELLFPNVSAAQVRAALLHPLNLGHSMDEEILLQRCMDRLLDCSSHHDVASENMPMPSFAREVSSSVGPLSSSTLSLRNNDSQEEETINLDDAIYGVPATAEADTPDNRTVGCDKYSTAAIDLLESDSESLGRLSGRTSPDTDDGLPTITLPKVRDCRNFVTGEIDVTKCASNQSHVSVDTGENEMPKIHAKDCNQNSNSQSPIHTHNRSVRETDDSFVSTLTPATLSSEPKSSSQSLYSLITSQNKMERQVKLAGNSHAVYCLCRRCLGQVTSVNERTKSIEDGLGHNIGASTDRCQLSDVIATAIRIKSPPPSIGPGTPVNEATQYNTGGSIPEHTPLCKTVESKSKSSVKLSEDEAIDKLHKKPVNENLMKMLKAAQVLATANMTTGAKSSPTVIKPKTQGTEETPVNLRKGQAVGRQVMTRPSSAPPSVPNPALASSSHDGRSATVTIESTHTITYSGASENVRGNPNIQLHKTAVHGTVEGQDPAVVLPRPEVTLKISSFDHKDLIDLDHHIQAPSPILVEAESPDTVDLTVAIDRPDIKGPLQDYEDPDIAETDHMEAAPVPDLTEEEVMENERITIKDGVLSLFADVEDTYLDTLTRQYLGPDAVNLICNILLESKYPTAAAPQVGNATAAASASDVNSSLVPATAINRVFRSFNNLYAPSHRALCQIWKAAQQAKDSASGDMTQHRYSRGYSGLTFSVAIQKPSGESSYSMTLLKSRRVRHSSRQNIDPTLQRELDFIKLKNKQFTEAADHEVALQMNEREYEELGQLIECGCCYGEVPFESMVQCYDSHLFCVDCLKQYAQESIFGHGKADLLCMTDTCKSAFPKSQLERALPSDLLQRYEDRVKEESLNLADLGDLVRCPNCEFAALMDPADKVFRCQNRKCMKETCRHCKEDWKEHFGKRCEEIEKKDETKLRLEYEEKMTQAKVRTCHRCKSQFMKEDGCNKMICRCQAKMCYICRKPNINYDHFCCHPRDPGKKCTLCEACSLWTNADEDDNRAITELQKEAEQVRKTQGYEDDKLIGAPTGAPPAKKIKT